jgi:hypothetical protein
MKMPENESVNKTRNFHSTISFGNYLGRMLIKIDGLDIIYVGSSTSRQ